MQRLERILCTFVPLLFTGCATTAGLDLAPAAPDQRWQPAIDARGEILPGRSAQAGPDTHDGWVLPPNPALAQVPAPPPLDPQQAYTLPELIDIAQSSHPETRIAWNDARRAAAAAGIAQSAFLPQVSASVLGGHRSSHGRGSTLGVDNDQESSGSGATSVLSLQWLLFDFGQRDAVREAAQQASIAANIAFTAAHQRVIHEVALAYYAQSAAQARLATASQALINAREVQAAAEQRQLHGVGTVVDVMQARQATAQARLAEVRATGGAQDARQALISAMGISPLTKVRVAALPQRPLSSETLRSVDRIVSEALARRPDVLAAYAQEKAGAAGVRAAEADFKPKVFLSASGAYGTGHLALSAVPSVAQMPPVTNLSGNRWSNTVLLGITVPLFDGGLRNSRMQQARAEADRAVATSERVREEAVRQIVVAQNAVETGLSAHDASHALQAAARTSYDAATDAYRRGVGTLTAVTNAATQLLEATDAATDAYSGALAAAASLAFATGSLGSAPR